MNWFLKYKIANNFYNIASRSDEYKKMDLKRWGRIHILLAQTVGLDLTTGEGLSSFMELSDVFRELTNRHGRLPNKNEFIVAWESWQKYKSIKPEGTKGYEYDGIEVGQPYKHLAKNNIVAQQLQHQQDQQQMNKQVDDNDNKIKQLKLMSS